MKRLIVLLILALAFAGSAFAACTTALPTQFKADALAGVHDTTDTYKMAFFTSTAAYDATSTAYSATNEVAGTGYTAGGYTLTGPTAGSDGTTGYLDFTDLSEATQTWTEIGACAIIYNTTDSNKIVAVYDVNPTVQPTGGGTLTVTFPAPAAATAPIRFAFDGFLDWLFSPNEAVAADYVTRRDAHVVLPSLVAFGDIH